MTRWSFPLTALVAASLLMNACSPPEPEPEPNPPSVPSAPPADSEPKEETPEAEQAAAPRPEPAPHIPIEQLFDNPKIAAARLSPDGSMLTFLQPWENRLNVFVTELKPGEDFEAAMANARRITSDKRRGIRSYFWTRDGKYVIYAQDKDGDENYHLFRVDPRKPDEAAVDLTPFDNVRAMVVDLPRKTPGEMLVAMNQRDPQVFDVHRLDIATGKLELVEENPGDVDGWVVDNQGRVRGAQAKVGTDTIIRMREGGTGPFKDVATYKDEEGAGVHGFDENDEFIWIESSRDTNTSHLAKFDPKTGQETEIIAQDEKYDFGAPIVSDKTGKLLGVVYTKERQVYDIDDPELKQDIEFLAKQHHGDIHIVSTDADEKKFIVAYVAPDDPGPTYLFDRETDELTFLYRPRPWLKQEWLAPMTPVQYETRDGKTIHGYLTLPRGYQPTKPGEDYGDNLALESLTDPELLEARTKFFEIYRKRAEEGANREELLELARTHREQLKQLTPKAPGNLGDPFPLILNVHGGPWARDSWGYDPEAQFFANRGYAVLQVNFRGSTGYGKEFLEAGNKQWGDAMLDDKIDAVDWAVAAGIADPEKLAIYGGSYGGYATLAALAFRPDVFDAGVDMVGPSNLFTLMETIPPYWETFRQSMYRRVGDPEKDKDLLRRHSPLFSADKIQAPLFIAQGYHDPRVKKEESDQIVEALKKNGHTVEYMLPMDEGHGFANPENRIEFYRRAEQFFNQHLHGNTPKAVPAEPPAENPAEATAPAPSDS